MNFIRKRLSAKLFILSMIPIVLFIIVTAFYTVPSVRDDIYEARRQQTRDLGEVGLTIIEHYYELEQAGEMSSLEAQNAAAEALRSVRFGERMEDYYWINDYHHEMIMHPFVTELEGQSVEDMQDPDGVYLFQEMVNIVEEEGEGYVEYQWQYYDDEDRIEPKISYVIGFEPWGWIVGTGIYVEDIAEIVLSRSLTLVGFIGGTIIVAILITWILSNSMVIRPIKNIVEIAEKLGKGNLKEKVNVTRGDEIGQLGTSFNNMGENLKSLIKEINNGAEQMASSSQELSANSEETTSVANEVAKAIEDIANGASTQAEDTDRAYNMVDEFGQLLKENQTHMDDLNKSMNNVDKLKEEGTGVLSNLTEKTNESNEAAKEVYQVIDETNQSAKEIQEASKTIGDIAGQTNLLALNASIEAARAGEYGEGFAVVADEIRKLAEQSNEYSDQITSVIQKLSNKTEKAVSTMDKVGKIVESQNQGVAETEGKFEDISKTIEETKEIIEHLNKTGKSMEERKSEIIEKLESLSAIAEENSANTEEASSSVEEQTATMEEIAKASESLAHLAEQMQGEVSKFEY